MNFYECLGVPYNATQLEIEAAFTEWHRIFAPSIKSCVNADLSPARQVCEAYRVLGNPRRRLAYDELLVWLQSPTMDGAISDEEFRTWLAPGRSIIAGLNEVRAAEEREARRLWRVASAGLDRVVSSRRSWVGLTCWMVTWVSGAAVIMFAWRSVHLIFVFATRLHR